MNLKRSLLILVLAGLLQGQTLTQQGFIETGVTIYPQSAPGDSGQAISNSQLNWQPSLKWGEWRFNFEGDAFFDSHRMAERKLTLSYWDRGTLRPAFEVRRLSASWSHGPVTLEVGKQEIRWGKTDVLNPTDRFSPRDFLEVTDPKFLGVTAARLTVANQSDSLDVVYTPRMTPSRMPLLDQRWVSPQQIDGFSLADAGARYPGGGQYGVRWNHNGRQMEHAVSYFRGFNTMPLLNAQFNPYRSRIDVSRMYPELQTVGADVAVPLPWFTVKAESAWFTSTMPLADRYVLYVAQAERQWREWLFLGGYAGQYAAAARNFPSFDADRGLTRAFIAHASWTIDPKRSLALEAVERQNGAGFYAKAEYSQGWGQNWRITGQSGLIRGSSDDFLGQYRRNSFVKLIFRYTF